MANVLTDLAADLYVAADTVSRELVGMIPAVTLNSGAERAALNGTVRSHFTRAATAVNNTPAMTIPEGTDQTVDNKTITISKSKGVQIPWTGEDIKHVDNGSGFQTIYGDQVTQAMRTLVNEMEADLTAAARAAASRAYGTAGTTPLATANDYTAASNVLKILKDNGAPKMDNQLVINTATGANLIGKQSAVNAAGTDSMLRQGVLLDLAGMPLRESAQLADHTAGTASSATTDATGYAVGTTTITLASAGTGTILAGDAISFAGDSEKYVVVTGDADVSGGGTVVIQEPGLRQAIPASATAITVSADSATNLCFNRRAVELVTRAPALPLGGDAAVDRMVVVDPRSGIAFDVAVYKGFQKMMINISAAWGYKAWKEEHIAILLG